MFINNFYADCARVYKSTQGNRVLKAVKLLFVPSLHITFVYRLGHSFSKVWPPFNWLLMILYFPMQVIVKILYNTSIPAKTSIGPGFIILHPGAIYVHPQVVIEANVTINSQVIIGAIRLGDTRYPVICNDCSIGCGAKVLGPVRVNHHTAVGANAVVLSDTPSFSVVGGIPAKVLKVTRQRSRSNRSGSGGSGSREGGSGNRRPRRREDQSNVRIHSDRRKGIIHV